jgi:predicted aspartyl protease
MKSSRLTLTLIALTSSGSVFAQQAPAQPAQSNVVIEGNALRYVAPNTLDRIGRIWAPVMINGKGPFRLVLDTSASSSALVPSVVDRLALASQTKKARLIGVTGTAEVEMVHVDSMEIGTISLGGGNLPIVPDVFGGAEGALAPTQLTDQRIYIDFRKDLIQVTRSPGRGVEEGFTRIKADVDRRHLFTFDMRVGGVKTKAILSTGGQKTIGNIALRDALLKRARDGKEENIVGVTLDVATGQSIAVPPVRLGDVSFRNLHITFGEMTVFDQWKIREPALLLGMDLLGSLDTLVIDYKLEEIHFRVRK